MTRKRFKYTDEQLSRILSVSAIDMLGVPSAPAVRLCIEQCALATTSITLAAIKNEGGRPSRARAFDTADDVYMIRNDPDAMLRWMERNGMA
jgi:hypothetical protein